MTSINNEPPHIDMSSGVSVFSPPRMCLGCGSTETIEAIRDRNPQAVSCCPEREMLTLQQYRERLMAAGDAIVDTCDFGHRFAKLPDHPRVDGRPTCPHCARIGIDRMRWTRFEDQEPPKLGDGEWLPGHAPDGQAVDLLFEDEKGLRRETECYPHANYRGFFASKRWSGGRSPYSVAKLFLVKPVAWAFPPAKDGFK